MAISWVDQTVVSYTDIAESRSFSHTVPAGDNRLLLLLIVTAGNRTGSSASFNGAAMTLWKRYYSGLLFGIPTTEIWGLVNPDVTTANVQYATNYKAAASVLAAVNLVGVNQEDALGSSSSANSSSGTTCSDDITTTELDSLVVGLKGSRGGNTYPGSAGAGVTERIDHTSGSDETYDRAAYSGDMDAAAVDTYTWSVEQSASGDWSVVLVEILAAEDAGTVYEQSADGAWTGAGAVVRLPSKALAGAASWAGAIARAIAHPVDGNWAGVGTLTRTTARALSGAISFARTLWRTTQHTVSGALTPSGALSMLKTFLQALDGAWTGAGALARRTTRSLAGGWAGGGVLARSVARSLSGAWTGAGAVYKTAARSLAGALTTAGALGRMARKSLAGAWAGAGDVGTELIHVVLVALDGALALGGALHKATTHRLAGAWVGAGTIAKRIAKALAGAWAGVGTFVKYRIPYLYNPLIVSVDASASTVQAAAEIGVAIDDGDSRVAIDGSSSGVQL